MVEKNIGVDGTVVEYYCSKTKLSKKVGLDSGMKPVKYFSCNMIFKHSNMPKPRDSSPLKNILDLVLRTVSLQTSAHFNCFSMLS